MKEVLNGLDLFSGIGGISLALAPWVRTVAYCESDKYCQAVLLSRMRDSSLDYAPLWDDVRTLDSKELSSLSCPIGLISGGFPCQDISVAGHGKGLDGERSGLFFQITRLVYELRPGFVFLENVPAITTRGGIRVISEFTELGYDCRWTVLSAKEVGACHLRRRWFMLAHADSEFLREQSEHVPELERENVARVDGHTEHASDSDGSGLEGQRRKEQGIARPSPYHGWKSQPCLRRGNHGIRHRVDRIRALGNAVVPIQAREAFMRLSGLK